MSNSTNSWLVGLLCLAVGAGGMHFYNQSNSGSDGGAANPKAAAVDEARVKEIVREVLADEPEMIVNSLQAMQAKEQEQAQAKMSKSLEKYEKELKKSPNSPKVGAKEPKVTLIEFYDYRCGYCKRVTPVIARVLKEHKDVQVVFKEFPILSEGSQLAARAALAFSRLKPEVFFDYHTALMEHKGRYVQADLNKMAEKFGVKGKALQKEMQAGWVTRELEETKKIAQSIGVRGTPAMVVGTELIPGAASYEAVVQLIEAEREGS